MAKHLVKIVWNLEEYEVNTEEVETEHKDFKSFLDDKFIDNVFL